MSIRIIGIDCSTETKRTGLARGEWRDGSLVVSDAMTCGATGSEPVAVVHEWVKGHEGTVLLAIDAPLGWPIGMRTALRQHAAGDALVVHANDMFRRLTDTLIKKRLGKTPLDVGADRIARTAHQAIHTIDTLRRRLKTEFQMAWSPVTLAEHAVIEVYPAALLAAHQLDAKRYKLPADDSTGVQARARLFDSVCKRFSRIEIAFDQERVLRNSDALDAVLCVISGAEFLDGDAVAPADHDELAIAKTEGWIWASELRTLRD